MGTAAKRNARIASALASKATESHLLTTTVLPVPVERVTIHQIKAYDYRRWLRSRSDDGAVKESAKANPISQWLIRLINTFPVNIIVGEGGLLYLIRALRMGNQLIKTQGISHIYSSYRPFADHYAAWILKKRHPHVCWIADFRDLIIDPHYQHIFNLNRHQRVYKKIFSDADVLTTVSDGLAQHLKAYNSNVITLRNGINDPVSIPDPVTTDYFYIVYTGSMFLDKRNAEPLFKAVRELLKVCMIEAEDIRIVYAGKDGDYWKNMARQYHFEEMAMSLGIISGDEARQWQHRACVNVLLTVSSPSLSGVLTGKMIEYIEAGSPVLAISVYQQDEELKSILEEIQIGTCVSDQDYDVDNIQTMILTEYQHWKKSGTNRKPVHVDLVSQKYSMEAVMRPLYARLGE